MLGNCEQMVAIPPTTNQWPQNNQISGRVMEKPAGEEVQQQQQQQQESLKCPRCDSSNTKFCYYNNYSLSQPRHFCKACKRYWTRGGTLRNVPVGGGCRSRSSNKRLIKRSITTSSSTNFDVINSSPSPTISTPQIDTSSTSNQISPLFYALSSGSNSCDVNLPFSRFNNNSRISSSGFDFQPQMNATGLGFSSGFTFNNNTPVSNYGSIFRSSSSTSSSNNNTPIMLPSLLSSSNPLQHELINRMGLKNAGPDGSSNTFQLGLASLDQMQTTRMVALKDMKGEGSQNRSMEWNGACQNNQIEHVQGLFDPSLYWNTASSAMGVWNDQPS